MQDEEQSDVVQAPLLLKCSQCALKPAEGWNKIRTYRGGDARGLVFVASWSHPPPVSALALLAPAGLPVCFLCRSLWTFPYFTLDDLFPYCRTFL